MDAFDERVAAALGNERLHVALGRATAQLGARRAEAFASLPYAEHVRELARKARIETLASLDQALVRFEERLLANGVTVHWAETAEDACAIVLTIASERRARRIVKAKSMVTEEIRLNEALERRGLEVLETDLGEYVVQLNHDRPSHIILPIIHMTKEDVGSVLQAKIGIPWTDDPAAMAKAARIRLREAFLAADIGVTGANFGVVESGTIALVSNEGNIRMVTTLPRVHVALIGIEKLVPTLDDLDRMLKVLPRSATGQKLTAYTSLIKGPRRSGREDGPDEVHVILLDNGRSAALAGEEAEILACVRCGACLNVCPVYQQIGGHAYGDTYPGPIGSVLTPLLRGLEGAARLPSASSLCGACRDACPVRIDLPRMLLDLRRQTAERGLVPKRMAFAMRAFAAVARRPWLYRLVAGIARRSLRRSAKDGWIVRGRGPVRAWTEHRDLPAPAPRTFDRWFRQRGRDD